MRSLPSDKANAAGSKHHGYGQYQSVMLGLLNRQDGVVSIAQEVMIELQASPAHIWKEWRYVNRVCEHRAPPVMNANHRFIGPPCTRKGVRLFVLHCSNTSPDGIP
jgi:hypothetical protein